MSSRRYVLYLAKTLYKNVQTELMIPMSNVAFYEHRLNTNTLTVHTRCGEKFPVQVDNIRLKQLRSKLHAAQQTVIEL